MPCTYHLKFGIKIVKLQNVVDQGLHEKIFIRYHIPTFNNRKIQVDTREIQNKNNVSWDESASFECHANFDQIELVEKSNHIAFELRSRRSKQGFGGIMSKSRLLGRGEISWGNLVGSEQMKLEKWVNLSAKGLKLDEFDLPNLLVEMEVQVTRDARLNGKKKCRLTKDCDCVGCEVDIFHVETVVD
ncbi:nitric oxide synthase-interacting protein [Rhynchospora pubera]|uniref:Nitric oxide synthase-interacting protein n=1 Tax=Rhynchospora pubera TaxID=906938 RepID=A0AAV8FTG1_9POAL|nr:nitric oxide synthase-interacting protein [Rhynchospora pubera]